MADGKCNSFSCFSFGIVKRIFSDQFYHLMADAGFGEPISAMQVSGGSINDAYQLLTSEGKFFLKSNDALRFPNMFKAESHGLDLLQASDFVVPKPLLVSELDGRQVLLMEWIDKGALDSGYWQQFGQKLAGLHRISQPTFGLDQNNYIGSLVQRNDRTTSWPAFFRDNRLLPQMEMAERNGRITTKMLRGFDNLFKEIENLFPMEVPSLIHGDLWSGNMMVATDGIPAVFDPAVYFGHREMDLAMMALFGGFGDAWVNAYNEVYPLAPGWRDRIPIGQLYPLMVHVNLFGGGYANDVESILAPFQ